MCQNKFRGVCWQITVNCNMKCPICLSYSGEQSVTIRNKKIIVDRIKSFGFKSVALAGGEPFLDKDLIGIAKYAKRKELYIGISTNGLLLSPNICMELNSCIDEISLPLDGSNPMTHAFHRHSYDHFNNTIRLFKILKTCRFHTDVSTVLTKLNKNDVHKLLGLLLHEGIKRWKIHRFYSIGRGALNNDKYELSNEDFLKVTKQLLKEPAIQSGQIEVLIRDNSDLVMKSYVNISPAGNILIFHHNTYRNIGKIVDIVDIQKLLRDSGFQFEIHSKRHFKGQ